MKGCKHNVSPMKNLNLLLALLEIAQEIISEFSLRVCHCFSFNDVFEHFIDFEDE